MHCAAVDVDELLEEGEIGVGVGVDGLDHLVFGCREGRRGWGLRDGWDRGGEQQKRKKA